MKLATLCYLKKGNKTLMLHRVKKKNDIHQGKWNGLGDKLRRGETPEECIIREVKEESGYSIVNPVLKGFITFPAFKQNEDWYVFLYIADQFTGKMIKSPEGNLQWIENEQLYNLNLWEGDKIFLRWLDEQRFFSAKFEYINGKLIDHNVVFY